MPLDIPLTRTAESHVIPGLSSGASHTITIAPIESIELAEIWQVTISAAIRLKITFQREGSDPVYAYLVPGDSATFTIDRRFRAYTVSVTNRDPSIASDVYISVSR